MALFTRPQCLSLIHDFSGADCERLVLIKLRGAEIFLRKREIHTALL